MSDTRYFKDVARINGRPALVNVTIHPSGRRFVDLASIEYLDAEFPPEKRERLERLDREVTAPCPTPAQHREECAAQLAAADEYRSPAPAIVGLLAILGSIVCAVLGAAAFGTGPLTLVPMLGGFAWWIAAVALGWVAYRWIKAATR